MKKRWMVAAAILAVMTATACAEQPKAAEYRKILQSGNFQLEYGYDPQMMLALVSENGNRGEYSFSRSKGLMGVSGGNKICPQVLYRNGKYYQFENNKKAIVATPQDLLNDNIDPRMNWPTIKYRLGIPAAFTPLLLQDSFRAFNGKVVFVESGKRMTGKKEMAYDKYVMKLNNTAGTLLGQQEYIYYYDDKGELNKIDMVYKMRELENTITVYVGTVTGTVDEKFKKMPNGLKVYAVGLGDMDDLLEKTPLVEEYKDEDKEKGGEN